MMDTQQPGESGTPSDATHLTGENDVEQTDQPTEDTPSQASPDATAPLGSAESDQTAATTSPRLTRPIKIGSQRNDGLRTAKTKTKSPILNPTAHSKESGPVTTEAATGIQKPKGKKQAAPAIDRTTITADVQKEIDVALGGEAIDALMQSGGENISARELAEGDRTKGRILSMNEENIFIDLEQRNQGIVSRRQLKEIPPLGSVVDVVVSRFDHEEGLYELAMCGAAVNVASWNELSEGQVVDAMVTGHNKGGLEVAVNRLKGFVPISQVTLYRVDDLEEFVGQKFSCVVIELDVNRHKLVLSRRAILERERAEAQEQLIAGLEVGAICEGVVTRLQPFGAFVDIGGIDGLIHISQLSWDRIGHPKEILEEGQKIKAKISRIDPKTGKIGLSYRDIVDNPWDTASSRYQANSCVTGTVSKLTDFGAFVRLEAGIEGLLHVSEISHKRVFRPSDVLSEGEQLELQVLSIDLEAQRISLSRKALEQLPAKAETAGEKDALKEPLDSPSNIKKQNLDKLKGGTDQASGGEQFGLKW